MSTLWLDIDDLVSYLRVHARPSGIQRVVVEIGRALQAEAPEQVGFVCRGNGPCDLVTVGWAQIEELLTPGEARKDMSVARVVRQMGQGSGAGGTLRAIMGAQVQAVRAGVAVPAGLVRYALERYVARRRERLADAEALGKSIVQGAGYRLADVARPGDTLMVLGSPWHYGDYARTIRWVRDELRMSFAVLIHDLIPVRRPQWCDHGIIMVFAQWHRMVLPLADRIFANSRATAEDVTAFMREARLPLAAPVGVVPIGSGFGGDADRGNGGTRRISAEYVLFVSTIEARKNHELLFRVWRRLLETMPKERVPKLVFAGRSGWLVSDLMQQLENSRWLDGHVVHVNAPTDAELNELYENCLFTVFPSFFEGWGLPVTESLGHGRPCVSSNTTSLPEAGGAFARYFNPHDVGDAYRVIREVIEDRAGLEAWTEEVRRDYVPTSWSAAARFLLGAF